jgi:hypothetical protein
VSWGGQQTGSQPVFLLPPPFVRNVYEQRGFFLDTSGTGSELRGTLTLDVRFPRSTAAGEFRVIRRGQAIDVWPPVDPEEQQLVSWSRQIAARATDEAEIRKQVAASRADGSFPAFWRTRELVDFEKHVNGWLSVLDWVLPATCVTALPTGGEPPMRYEVLELKVRALARANSTFFNAFIGATETSDLTGFPVLERVLAFAREELAV